MKLTYLSVANEGVNEEILKGDINGECIESGGLIDCSLCKGQICNITTPWTTNPKTAYVGNEYI
jgi:hypothetical protein